jgi:hypothetical protein
MSHHHKHQEKLVIDVDIESIQQDRLLRHILHYVRKIYEQGKSKPTSPVPTGGKIVQIAKGENTMSITGTIPGTTSTFEADALLNGIQDPAGWPGGTVDTWTCDDPLAVVGPDSGPDVNQPGALDQVTVSIPVTDTQGSAPAGQPGSYNLRCSVQIPPVNGVTPPPMILGPVNVPIQAVPVPVPTGGVINQIS